MATTATSTSAVPTTAASAATGDGDRGSSTPIVIAGIAGIALVAVAIGAAVLVVRRRHATI